MCSRKRSSIRSLRHVIICISTEKNLVSFPRERLTYLVLHIQCGCNTMLVYLPKLAALAVECWLSHHQLQCGSGRRCRIASGWYTTLRQVTSSAVGVGYINRRPSSLRLCDLQGHRYCLDTFIHMVVSLHVQYVGHIGLPPMQNYSSRVDTMSSMLVTT